ncbi:MAG: hypothetical protein ACXABY_02570 [Candidatus Thorarchaeota archaeon]|jgi:hypothetical protein
MPSITIRWGAYPISEEDERPVDTIEFDTQVELDAYMKGVNDMDGWAGYTIMEDEDGNS